MTTIDLRSMPFRSDDYREGFLAGFKFFVLKEVRRHSQDIGRALDDIRALKDIPLPHEGLNIDIDGWYEVAPEKGTTVPETSTQTTQMRGKNTQYETKGE